MRIIATLVCVLTFSFAQAEKRNPIGSLPLKNGSVLLVQEYLSKAKLPQKVLVVSPYEEVYSFCSGVVTKVLRIDDRVSVFVKKGRHYFIYKNLYAVAVEEGEHIQKGELIAALPYSRKYSEYQMEMQVWYDNGAKTCRLPNSQVVDILYGAAPAPPRVEKAKKVAVAKKKPGSKYRKSYGSKKKSYSKKKTYAHKGKKPVKKTVKKKRG